MSLTKNIKIVIFCLVLAAVISIIPLIMITDSEFSGADGMAENLISVINPAYEAWVEPLMEPPGGETESLLFCLQAALGAGLLSFGFGYLVARKTYMKKNEDN